MRAYLLIVFAVLTSTCVLGQQEGEPCTMKYTERPGECKLIYKCRDVLAAVFKQIFPQTCSYRGTVQVVCCPSETVVEGNNCTMKGTGVAGKCRRFANCQIAREAAFEGILPQKCDLLNHGGDLVCCSTPCRPLPKGTVTQQLGESKAADYCADLAEKVYPCHETSHGWTRGDLCPQMPDSSTVYSFTPLNTTFEVPHMGKVGIGKMGNITWKEVVNLISDRWVISSAYYADKIRQARFVGLGGSFNPFSPDAIYEIVRFLMHPDYNRTHSNVYHNIGLLQLDRTVRFTSRILPACLCSNTLPPNIGMINAGSDNDLFLDSKTTMNQVPHDECSRIFRRGSSLHPDGVDNNIELCSRPAITQKQCKKNSAGSPLQIYNGPKVACTHLLLGIQVARDPKTCTFISLRISGYLPWIESVVWP